MVTALDTQPKRAIWIAIALLAGVYLALNLGLTKAIGGFFGVPISAFFDGVGYLAGEGQSPVALLSEPYALRLVQAFCALENDALRRSIFEFVEVMANAKATSPTPRTKFG